MAAVWPLNPWERCPLDTDKTWHLFQEWLLSFPRPTLAHLAKRFRIQPHYVEGVADDCHWWPRAEAYDRHMSNQRFALASQQQATAQAVAGQGFELGHILSHLSRRSLATLADIADKTDHPVLDPSLAVKMALAGSRLQRESFALLPPAIQASSGTGLERLTDDELATYRTLQAKIEGPGA